MCVGVRAISLKISEVAGWMERLAPTRLAEEWDAVGLQIGDGAAPVSRAMTALTLTPDVVRQAAMARTDLIIAHHPLIFRPLKTIDPHSRVGFLVTQLIKEEIALYVAHTNLDSATGGVNDGLTNRLGLDETVPLVPSDSSRRYKLVTFVPVDYEADVREALAQSGAGVIGKYTHCAFATIGWGSFKPLAGADPHIGRVGELEQVQEVRLEMVVDESDKARAVEALCRAHPYEEVAYDLYPLDDGKVDVGIGRIGSLPRSMALDEFVRHVKECLRLDGVRLCGARVDRIRRVAVVGGSGGSFVNEALRKGADALITGDVDYHDADEARHGGLLVIDAGHFGTEKHVPHDLKEYLDLEATKAGASLEVLVAEESDAFWTIQDGSKEGC